jgi:photosystem II stability/assembly factor-like uncharacterized protein
LTDIFSRRDILGRLMTAPWWGMARRSSLMQSSGVATTRAGWQQLRFGAGGYVTRIETAPDGKQVCRVDTYGAYERPNSSSPWVQIVTTDRMPAGKMGWDARGNLRGASKLGAYEISQAPSNSDILYMMWNHEIYRSTNRGQTWTLTNWPATMWNVGQFRTSGPRLAIDPGDPDHVIACGHQTIRRTTDGGRRWNTISGVGNPTSEAGGMAVFDPNDASKVYIFSDGNGVYQSTNGGDTFSAMTADPTTFLNVIHDNHGRVWVISRTGALWKLAGRTWSTVNYGNANGTGLSVAVKPGDADYIVVASPNGSAFSISTNGGTNWSSTAPGTPLIRHGIDIGWHGTTNANFFSHGNIEFAGNRLWIAHGMGVFFCDDVTPVPATIKESSIGIENMVCRKLVWTMGGILGCFMDRPFFKAIPGSSTYPANHGINYDTEISHGYAGDRATSAPQFVAGFSMDHFGGFPTVAGSDDGGLTWDEGNTPSGLVAGGCFAASTHLNWVLAGTGNDSRVKYTTDAGQTWANVTAGGLPTSGETGLGPDANTQSPRHIVCADRVANNKFYMYTNGTFGSAASAGLWVSTDGGATFTKNFNGRIDAGHADLYALWSFYAKLEAVPGEAGHLYITPGAVLDGQGHTGNFMKSTDEGVTWNALANLKEVMAFGFGKARPGGGGYPVIYIAGWKNNVYGIYKCENGESGSPTWDFITDYPAGIADEVTAITGDMDVYGRVVVGFRGTSAVCFEP